MALAYSCCFWFSLRLAGILIAIFSIMQAAVGIIIFAIAYKYLQSIKDQVSLWIKDLNLIYVNGFLEIFGANPEKYITYAIIISSIYIFFCSLFIYGAYSFNNAAMVGYIVMELIRLATLSILMVTWLLVLKQNSMDIGLVIGASVAGGFVLLGMYYLWVCAASLPILINEIERDEQLAKIHRLQQLLDSKNQRYNANYSSFDDDEHPMYRQHLFVVTRSNFTKPFESRSYQ